MTFPATLIRRIATAPIRMYQRWISPLFPPRCRYAPTCSQYALESIEIHGLIKGTILGVWRILRCNPWSYGGVDRVPPPGRWTADAWIPPADWAGNDPNIVRPLPMGLDLHHDDSLTDRDGTMTPQTLGGTRVEMNTDKHFVIEEFIDPSPASSQVPTPTSHPVQTGITTGVSCTQLS